MLSFSLETVYPPTLSSHLTDGEKQCTPTLFFPTLQMGKNNVPPHSFFPPYRWGKTVYPSLFFPTLQMERKSELHPFSPSVRWKFENVPHTLFSHCNKMGKKSVPPTLFFPIIEGEKVQRVRNFTEPYIITPEMRTPRYSAKQTGFLAPLVPGLYKIHSKMWTLTCLSLTTTARFNDWTL